MVKRKPPVERTGIIPAMLGASPYSSRAQKLQATIGTPDSVLTDLARRQHPSVAWWWGVRRAEGRMSAWCYVCSGPILFGALNARITDDQQAEILAHRATHWEQARQIINPKP